MRAIVVFFEHHTVILAALVLIGSALTGLVMDNKRRQHRPGDTDEPGP